MAKKQKKDLNNLGEIDLIRKGLKKSYKKTKNIEDLTAIELLNYYNNLDSKIKNKSKFKKLFNLMLIPLIPIAGFFFYQYYQTINNPKPIYFSNKTGYYDVYSLKKYDLSLNKKNSLNLKYNEDLRLIVNKTLNQGLKQQEKNKKQEKQLNSEQVKQTTKLNNVVNKLNKQDLRYKINKIKGVYYLLDKKKQINYRISNLIDYDLKDMIYLYAAKHNIPEYELPNKIINIILKNYDSTNLYSEKTKDKLFDLIVKDNKYIPELTQISKLISRYSKKQELFENLDLYTIENIIEYNISKFTDEQKKRILNDVFIPIIFNQISDNAKNIGILISNLYHNYIQSKNEIKEKQYLDSLKVHKQNLDLLIKLYKNK